MSVPVYSVVQGAVQALHIPAGQDCILEITGTASFTNTTLVLTIRDFKTIGDPSTATLRLSRQGTIQSDPTKCRFIIGAGDTQDLKPGAYVYDIWQTLAGGERVDLVPYSFYFVDKIVGIPGTPVTVPPAQQPLALGPGSIDTKDACHVATTANITLSGLQTIDGQNVLAGWRVLVKDQTTGSQNGIYVAAAGAWARATDFNATAGVVTFGAYCPVMFGAVNGNTIWGLSTLDPITVGTTALTFSAIGGGGSSLPSQIGNSGKYLTTDGTSAAWGTINQDMIAAGFTITGFSANGFSTVQETGATVTNPAFLASYNRTPATVTINDGSGATSVSLPATSFTKTGSYTSSTINAGKTFTLSANETGGPTKTATVSIAWRPRVFSGIAAIPGAYDETFIEGLTSSALAGGFAGSVAFSPTGTEKCYYVFPTAFGTPNTFKNHATGFAVPFTKVASAVSVTNANGAVHTYDVWESDNYLTSSITVDVA